jgi:hypothetical protein
MPKFLERKLKQEYGKKSAIPYKVMNSIGAMRGSKETEKGREMEAKHQRDKGEQSAMKKQPAMQPMREMRIEIHRGPATAKMEHGPVTGFTVHHHMMPMPTKSPAFMESTTHSQPFSLKEHDAMMDHIDEHTAGQMGKSAGAAEAAMEAPEEVDE